MQRDFLQLSFGGTLIGRSGNVAGWAPGLGRELQTGDQTDRASVVVQPAVALERMLAPRGIKLEWSEFTADPPTLKAMNTGGTGIWSTEHRTIRVQASGCVAGRTPGL